MPDQTKTPEKHFSEKEWDDILRVCGKEGTKTAAANCVTRHITDKGAPVPDEHKETLMALANELTNRPSLESIRAGKELQAALRPKDETEETGSSRTGFKKFLSACCF